MSVEKGYTESMSIEKEAKKSTRDETDLKTQRPVIKSTKVKGDGGRGSFTIKG